MTETQPGEQLCAATLQHAAAAAATVHSTNSAAVACLLGIILVPVIMVTLPEVAKNMLYKDLHVFKNCFLDRKLVTLLSPTSRHQLGSKKTALYQ